MNVIIILIIALLLIGIILLSGSAKIKKRTREEYLQDLAKFLEGNLEPIEDEGYFNSYRIRFKFSDEDFVYEDLERQGFKDKVYMAHLKVETPSSLTLTFSEKKRSSKIKTNIFIASDVSSQQFGQNIRLQVPKQFSDLDVKANDTKRANELFAARKVSSILKQLKSKDSRGYSYVPIEIIDGTVILKLFSEKLRKPNLSLLYSDISSIDSYLNKLMIFVRELRKVY